MPEHEPKIGDRPIPDHLLKHTYRNPPAEKRLLAGAKWKPAQKSLLTTINDLRAKIPQPSPPTRAAFVTADQVAFKGRSNLAGELRRVLDRLVYDTTATRSDGNDAYQSALEIRSTFEQSALGLFEAWNQLPLDVNKQFIASLKNLDKELKKLSELPIKDAKAQQTFSSMVDAIRREIVRQAHERLYLEVGVDPSDAAGPGDKNAWLVDHLTEFLNTTRSRVHTAARDLWRELAKDRSSSRLSSDMKQTDLTKAVRDFMSSSSGAIAKCERSLGEIITAVAESESGEKIDAGPFTAICKDLASEIEKTINAARNSDDPSRKTMSPREIELADQYLRQVASVLAEMLDAVPPRDWLELAGLDQTLRAAIDKIRRLDSAKPGSAERRLKEHPEELTSLWSTVTSSAIDELKGDKELDKYRQQLKTAFGSKDLDLTGELKKLAAAKDANQRQASAQACARIINDLMGELRSLKFTRQQRNAESACVRMEEALSAIGAAIAEKMASRIVRAA